MSDGTNAPFRELFVELQQALLEILQGVVDGQTQRIATPPLFKAGIALTLCEALELGPLGRMACAAYGWEQIVASRSAVRTSIEIVCVRPCRYSEHCPSFNIRDSTLEDVAPPLMRDLVMQMFRRAAMNSCYCVAPPRLRHVFDEGSAARPTPDLTLWERADQELARRRWR